MKKAPSAHTAVPVRRFDELWGFRPIVRLGHYQCRCRHLLHRTDKVRGLDMPRTPHYILCLSEIERNSSRLVCGVSTPTVGRRSFLSVPKDTIGRQIPSAYNLSIFRTSATTTYYPTSFYQDRTYLEPRDN